MTARPVESHLSVDEVAARVDGMPAGDVSDGVAAHLALCADCRAEVAEVSRIVRTVPAARLGRRIWIPAAAAAALLLFFLPRAARDPAPLHREGAVTIAVPPLPAAPRGRVLTADTLVWSAAYRADRYRVRLFEADGSVIWEGVTDDTLAVIPPSIHLSAGESYYWKVEARTRFDRWVASDLVVFSLSRARR